MPEFPNFRLPSEDVISTRNILVGVAALFALTLATAPVSPAHAAWTAFLFTALMSAWVMSRDLLKGTTIERKHRPRVFENNAVPVTLCVRQAAGLSQTLVMAEDQFGASLRVRQLCLIPMMNPKWEARLHYRKDAERHRGVYLLGPVRLWAADPLGVFYRSKEIDCVTRLTVYPHAVPLDGYRIAGPHPSAGPALATDDRIGQGEEIVSVRPYQPGDPMTRIHWRTSTRRRQLHTIELDTNVQSEVAIFVDLTRASRFGTGVESTTEVAIGCATSVLTQASTLRHRVSLTWVRDQVQAFPPGAGLAQLHLLLDRLATINFGGDLKFWREVADRAALLGRGSKAIFIVPAASTPIEEAATLIRSLELKGVGVDVILLDESGMTRIWRDQQPTIRDAAEAFARLKGELERAGARVLPILRGELAGDLLPRAAEAERRGLLDSSLPARG